MVTGTTPRTLERDIPPDAEIIGFDNEQITWQKPTGFSRDPNAHPEWAAAIWSGARAAFSIWKCAPGAPAERAVGPADHEQQGSGASGLAIHRSSHRYRVLPAASTRVVLGGSAGVPADAGEGHVLALSSRRFSVDAPRCVSIRRRS
ncbi:hypothetical protein ACIPN8_36450 [Streptomyces sp. NPDC086082]|uniref:hypothetical protein n=1 Tax=Streptomyces sp. NPDC086082 TaxID=3365750 RepID=UPI003822FD83